MTGILLSGSFGDNCHLVAGLLTAFGILIWIVGRHMAQWWGALATSLLFMAGGIADMSVQALPAISDGIAEDTSLWSGTVTEVTRNDRGTHMVVKLDSPEISVIVHSPHGVAERVVEGDRVMFDATFEIPRGEEYPGGIDYRIVLERKGISLTTFADNMEITGHVRSINAFGARCRRYCAGLLEKSRLNDATCAFLCALIVGDDTWIDDQERDIFSSAGIAHILALSGLHVGILVMLFGIVLLPLGHLTDWRLRYGCIILLIWGYALITGLSPSVTRSALMATMVGVGIILQRPYVAFNAMLSAALIILMVSPRQLWAPGFQMSFMAVCCILLFLPPLQKAVAARSRWLRGILLAAGASVAAMLGTSLIALRFFNIFPVYFIFGNLPVVMLLPVIMTGGIMLMVCEAAGYEPGWLCMALDWLYGALRWWAEWIASWPGAVLRGNVSPAALVVYYTGISALALGLWTKSMRWLSACGVAVTGVAVLILAVGSSPSASVCFVPRDAFFTTVICASPEGEVKMTTTAPPMAAGALRGEYSVRYRSLIRQYGADSLKLELIAPRDSSPIPGIIAVSGDSVVGPEGRPPVEYAIICRGYRGGWRSVADSLAPRVIVLSADIAKKRHNRILDSIRNEGYPVMSLRMATYLPSAAECEAN